jgi:hypothetical protein
MIFRFYFWIGKPAAWGPPLGLKAAACRTPIDCPGRRLPVATAPGIKPAPADSGCPKRRPPLYRPALSSWAVAARCRFLGRRKSPLPVEFKAGPSRHRSSESGGPPVRSLVGERRASASVFPGTGHRFSRCSAPRAGSAAPLLEAKPPRLVGEELRRLLSSVCHRPRRRVCSSCRLPLQLVCRPRELVAADAVAKPPAEVVARRRRRNQPSTAVRCQASQRAASSSVRPRSFPCAVTVEPCTPPKSAAVPRCALAACAVPRRPWDAMQPACEAVGRTHRCPDRPLQCFADWAARESAWWLFNRFPFFDLDSNDCKARKIVQVWIQVIKFWNKFIWVYSDLC